MKNNERIRTINGYSLKLKTKNIHSDVYFQRRPFSWGWATWKNRWNEQIFTEKFVENKISKKLLSEFKKNCGNDGPAMLNASRNGLIDSWFSKWMFFHFLEDNVSVYPYKSKIKNIGFNSEGSHCKTINSYRHKFDHSLDRTFNFNKYINIDKTENRMFLKYFTFKYKLVYRALLLRNISGIKLLYNDFMERFKRIIS